MNFDLKCNKVEFQSCLRPEKQQRVVVNLQSNSVVRLCQSNELKIKAIPVTLLSIRLKNVRFSYCILKMSLFIENSKMPELFLKMTLFIDLMERKI